MVIYLLYLDIFIVYSFKISLYKLKILNFYKIFKIKMYSDEYLIKEVLFMSYLDSNRETKQKEILLHKLKKIYNNLDSQFNEDKILYENDVNIIYDKGNFTNNIYKIKYDNIIKKSLEANEKILYITKYTYISFF